MDAQGLVITEQYYDSQTKDQNIGSKTSLALIDSIFDYSLKPYCPTPRQQGKTANCVGWAVGYAGQTILEARKNNITDQKKIDSLAFSPYFLYNHIKLKGCELGAEIPDAFAFLVRTGNVRLHQFEKPECSELGNGIDFKEATKHRINEYHKIFGPDDHPTTKINGVKKALIEGYPVTIAMNITQSFFELKSGQDRWYSTSGNSNPLGGHAMTIIGFDEVNNSFELMNSWGPDWANEGFVWINYDDFNEYVKYGFRVSDSNKTNFSLQINFKRKSSVGRDFSIHYVDELFRWNGKSYTNAITNYVPGVNYKFEIFHSSSKYHLYCFNRGNQSNYSLLSALDKRHFDFVQDHSLYGINIPIDEEAMIEFTDEVEEEFIFVVIKDKLSEDCLTQIQKVSSLPQLSVALQEIDNKSAPDNIIHTFNKVGCISDLQEDDVIILPVYFSSHSN